MKPQFNNQLKEYNLKFDIIFIQFPYHLFTGFIGAINSQQCVLLRLELCAYRVLNDSYRWKKRR